MGIPNPLQELGTSLVTDLKIGALLTLLGIEAGELADAIQAGQVRQASDIPGWVADQLEGAISDAEQLFGAPLWELLVRAPAGLNAGAIEQGQAGDAVAMVKRMLGFGLALPMLTAKLEATLKGILGDHAPEGLLESIRRLPEEIGVNFFIGTVLERIFETAVATPLEEAIAEQTRPARLDFRVIKALLTKHHLSTAEAESYLARIGYRDQDIAKLLELAESFLSVGDLQQLYLDGLWTAAQVQDYLGTLGYTPQDAATLVELYLGRAETVGAQQLRATARQGFLEGKLTAGEYRQLLEEVNTPAKSIDLELRSAELVVSWGRRQLTVAALKSQFQHAHLNDRQAIQQLAQLGFSEDDAATLIQTWNDERTSSRAGLSVQHVLAYELGGVLTPKQALAKLMESGMKPDDAQLLVQHPGAYGGVYRHPRNPATVLGALQEGVIDATTAGQLLEQLGVEPAEIQLQLATAVARMVRGQKPKGAHRALTEPQVMEAYKLGLAGSTWVLTELTALGYSDTDAQLLLATEDTRLKGAIPEGWSPLR